MKKMDVIDTHTGGEPTRIIFNGGPELGQCSLSERVTLFRSEFDHIRQSVVCEPRGSEVLVGGLICEPTNPNCVAGIIFFNTADYLGMCGHGLIGLMVTLKYLGKIEDGDHLIETPVGIVSASLAGSSVSVKNVPSYRYQKEVSVDVPGIGTVIGDIAWGGNWFFCVTQFPDEPILLSNVDRLTELTLKIRNELVAQKITGAEGGYIDHIELYGPAKNPENNSKNFVLCPGGAYDRSPCGTGTSAKVACLAAEGKLNAGQVWKQESIVGSVFECSYQWSANNKEILPTIRGNAYLSGETTLFFDPSDPFVNGISEP